MDMSAQVEQAMIFQPMLVVVALTMLAFFAMAVQRGKVAKSVPPEFYKTYRGGSEPDSTVVAVRHYGNLFEAPTVFYAGCLTAFVLGAVTPWLLLFAWVFVALRLLQSAVHLTVNNPMIRGLFFSASWLFLIAFWVDIAMAVFAKA